MEEFILYLSNINSKEKYIENTPSQFTSDIIPGIQLNPVTDWEAALKSCLLPFQGYHPKSLINKKLYHMPWVITEHTSNNSTVKNTYKVRIPITEFF